MYTDGPVNLKRDSLTVLFTYEDREERVSLGSFLYP